MSSENEQKQSGFPERLRALRRARGFRQKDLAQALGVSKSAVVEWEAGRNMPRPLTQRALCEVLKATEAQLRGDERLSTRAQFLLEVDTAALRKALERTVASAQAALAVLEDLEEGRKSP